MIQLYVLIFIMYLCLQAGLHKLSKGHMLADVVAIIGM